MYNLFLDDIRQPWEAGNYMLPVDVRKFYRLYDWVIVRNYKEFVETITEKGLPDLVSFDHDLADIHYDPTTWTESFSYEEETGYDCAKWMVNYCMENHLPMPNYLVHSMNPTGAENILRYLNNYKKFESNGQ